jgi:hypothetical protein
MPSGVLLIVYHMFCFFRLVWRRLVGWLLSLVSFERGSWDSIVRFGGGVFVGYLIVVQAMFWHV